MESAKTATDRSDAVERLHEQVQDSLQELVTSEDWQRALAVAARFHDYSFANTRLIWAQSLARGFTPSRVAGYRAWQELDRQVRRGERGLQILAPVIRKITPENGEEEERRVVGFRVVHVFDIAQTEGEPLPEVPVALVEGDLPSHWEQVSGLITEAGFELQVADLETVVSAATAFYQGQLREPAGAEALEYLRGRGIDNEASDRWQLGYAHGAWEALTVALREEGFSEDLLLEAGVAGRSRHGRLYDRMRSRVIFPIHDSRGVPRGFAGRLLSGDGPKYLNTPETELYQKRSLLYGLHLAHQPILDAGKAVVVEGYTDAIAAHQAGLTNVVATGGTALTEEHLKTLARTTSNVSPPGFDAVPIPSTVGPGRGDCKIWHDHVSIRRSFAVGRLTRCWFGDGRFPRWPGSWGSAHLRPCGAGSARVRLTVA